MDFYKGRGTKADEEQLLEVIDDVFFSDDDEETKRNFKDLLPKLYKEQYNPGYNNVMIKEDGKIKAAIGCFPLEATVAGRKLKVMGIGNVAVAKDSRRKGYMVELMNLALDIMKEEDYDYSLLGGDRQRYGYFGYEPVGAEQHFSINRQNIKHVAGKDFQTTFTAKEVTEDDIETVDKILELYKSLPYYMDRNRENCIDVLKSWRSVPYAAFENGEFKGYFAVQKFGGLQEIKAVNVEDTVNLIVCAMQIIGSDGVDFNIPVFDTEFCDYMAKICAGSSICPVDMVNIFNFAKFIEAFLSIKAQRMNLCPGTLNILIHGFKKDEKIAVTVDGKNVTVTETDAEPDLELEHHRAIDMLGGMFSKDRNSLPAFAQGWFPLDFFAYGQDNV
ncbi:MAG: GNAT family N-acetyltransferase [Clostridia bacterium]|nr:GNAT family N-acetyltransferase [Clostridia bacterium]MBQ7120696.1 GNAT family N-acetyltransferase [Clostridia bacterium]